jgi:ribosomal protein S12 methylthiotransferase accessory factor
MEAFELHSAETADLASFDASYDELATQYDLPEVTDLQLRRWNLFSTGWPVPWSLGWDMVNQRDAPVPTPLVGMFRGNRYVRSAGSFHVTSNGLGAGNTFLEAIAAALYEVIERDAVACSYAAEASNGQDLPVVQESTLFQYPLVEEVMRKCEHAGVAMIVHDCTIDTGVPTYNALAYDMQDQGVGVTKGSGSHLDPAVAILRATTEALQARLNFIAGSRDDVFRSAFTRMRSDWGKAVSALNASRVHSRPADNRSSRSGDSFEEDISLLIKSITQVGLSRVIVFDLTPPGFPVTVVRVVVPGLEGYQHHGFEPGSRVRRALRGELSHALG